MLHYPGEDKLIVNLLMENESDVTIQTQQSNESAFHYVAFSGNFQLLQAELTFQFKPFKPLNNRLTSYREN